MNDVEFSLWNLWPRMEYIYGSGGSSAEVLSAWFIVILLVIFVLFAIYTTGKFLRARRHVSFILICLLELPRKI